MADHTDDRPDFTAAAPPTELVQGLTVDDLSVAGERAFQRGWDAAGLHFSGEFERYLDRRATEERDAATAIEEGAQDNGRRYGIEEALGQLGTDTPERATWLRRGLERIIRELPKGTSETLRQSLEEQLQKAKQVESGVLAVKRLER